MTATEEGVEEAKAVAMEMGGEGENEGKKIRGTITAPNSSVVKRRE